MKQNDEWWNWREKIIQKEIKKTKQIAIKKIITKLNTKNNFKDTFIFYQGEEREKKKKKKKIHHNPTIIRPCIHVTPLEKRHMALLILLVVTKGEV